MALVSDVKAKKKEVASSSRSKTYSGAQHRNSRMCGTAMAAASACASCGSIKRRQTQRSMNNIGTARWRNILPLKRAAAYNISARHENGGGGNHLRHSAHLARSGESNRNK